MRDGKMLLRLLEVLSGEKLVGIFASQKFSLNVSGLSGLVVNVNR